MHDSCLAHHTGPEAQRRHVPGVVAGALREQCSLSLALASPLLLYISLPLSPSLSLSDCNTHRLSVHEPANAPLTRALDHITLGQLPIIFACLWAWRRPRCLVQR